jgi:hypothetical protein
MYDIYTDNDWYQHSIIEDNHSCGLII